MTMLALIHIFVYLVLISMIAIFDIELSGDTIYRSNTLFTLFDIIICSTTLSVAMNIMLTMLTSIS